MKFVQLALLGCPSGWEILEGRIKRHLNKLGLQANGQSICSSLIGEWIPSEIILMWKYCLSS